MPPGTMDSVHRQKPRGRPRTDSDDELSKDEVVAGGTLRASVLGSQAS